MINKDKRGTILLTHYRSGGTQLRYILREFLLRSNLLGKSIIDLEEINFDSSYSNKEVITKAFYNNPSGVYKVIQLNNPVVISYLHANGFFDHITKEFEVVVVERKNKANCLLSLPLWERFINEGLFESNKLWTEENINSFHNSLIDNPIDYSSIYNGVYHEHLPTDTPKEYLEKKLTFFQNSVNTVNLICNLFDLPKIYYDDYEFDESYLYENHFKNFSSDYNNLDYIKETYGWKIPYPEKNYVKYFDSFTQEVLKDWGLV